MDEPSLQQALPAAPPSRQPTPIPDSARAALRRATDAVHTRLHRLPALDCLATGQIDRAAYRRLLARLWGFHRPIEHRLRAAPWPTAALLMPQRRRAHLLHQDLRALGVASAEIADLPRISIDRLPALTDAARFLGCLYVREGATLGGRVLAAALDPLLGRATLSGRRFLLGTSNDPALWRLLCEALETVEPNNRDGLIAGASETFAALEAWLDLAPPTGNPVI
ncbi:biliverdin-producing heme oxygenase [Rhodopila sp.]|uniref:biliverdin-producing heme oxygenase n=1 Tax=Rhodopila sp. TaxID=2480087 RepID=UPI003D129214